MPTPTPQPNQVQISDSIAGAEYTNAMQVSHTKDEFLMMFANIAGPSGKVVSKVVTTPGHLKRIVAAFQDNLSKYEAKFGKIIEAEAPEKSEIGFQGK
ncbi:MAG: DUF3467 domain-containing protein [Patescibacteria group bacterium]